MKTRQEAVAGMFYPENKEELKSMINSFLDEVPEQKNYDAKALIVPHAGYVYSGPIAAYAYSLLKKNKKKKIILLGPSHTVHLRGVVSDNNDYWKSPFGEVKAIENEFEKLSEAHEKEHCLEVQIPFLQVLLDDFEILPLVAGDVNPKEISEKIKPLLDEDTLLIISSDLSHFKPYDYAVDIDDNTNKAILNLDYEKMLEEGDACGKIPILAVIDLAGKLGWKCKLLDYRNSGDTAGTKGEVVGYASFVFY